MYNNFCFDSGCILSCEQIQSSEDKHSLPNVAMVELSSQKLGMDVEFHILLWGKAGPTL